MNIQSYSNSLMFSLLFNWHFGSFDMLKKKNKAINEFVCAIGNVIKLDPSKKVFHSCRKRIHTIYHLPLYFCFYFRLIRKIEISYYKIVEFSSEVIFLLFSVKVFISKIRWLHTSINKAAISESSFVIIKNDILMDWFWCFDV